LKKRLPPDRFYFNLYAITKNYVMKTTYTLIALLLAAPFANAQVTKGTAFLGGMVNYGNSQTKDDNGGAAPETSTHSTSAVIAPSYGWAIKDGMVLGVNISYGHGTSEQTDNFTATSNSFGAGLFLRNYKYLGSRFSLFGATGFNFSYSHSNTEYNSGNPPNTTMDGYSVGVGFQPGVAYQISPSWQIEAVFPNVLYASYNHSKQTYSQGPGIADVHNTSDNFSVGSNLTNSFTLGIGLLYVIGKK
jgi:hypothetical protein